MGEQLRMVICGAGAGAHVAAGLASRKFECVVYNSYKDKTELWSAALKSNDLTVSLREDEIWFRGKPDLITRDAALAFSTADIIIVVTPSFSHSSFIRELALHIRPGTVICGMPGGSGFDLCCYSILKEKTSQTTIISFHTLPWACRINEFWTHVNVVGVKEQVSLAIHRSNPPPRFDPLDVLQTFLGDKPKLCYEGDLIAYTIDDPNAVVHPAVMYSAWKNWDGKPVKNKPLFYHGLSQDAATLVEDISLEVLAIRDAISVSHPEVDLSVVRHIKDLILFYYTDQVKDPTSLYTCFMTNSSWDGITHPMVPAPSVDDAVTSGKGGPAGDEDGPGKGDEGGPGYIPNFNCRYLTEDIPYGAVPIRGIADILGIKTPKLDQMIYWCQEKMGKEYLVKVEGGGDQLIGRDMSETRSPQTYNLTTIDQLLGVQLDETSLAST